MKKYLSVFKASIHQETAYRANFLMWRIRTIIQFFLVFFLWDTIFSNPGKVLFGYDKSRILTYVFGLLVIRAFVISSKATEVAGEISRGDLSNYLVKPINYFKYWFTRDTAFKVLNLSFAVFDTLILYVLLKPPLFLQTDPTRLVLFLLALTLAIILYFLIVLLTGTVPFWMPEAAWGANFLITVVVVELLSGSLFPLDVLPQTFQQILAYTPFPYLIFFPLQVYLGKMEISEVIKGIAISGMWLGILWWFLNYLWKKGMKVYQASGR